MFNFYKISSDYCEFLRKYDNKAPYNMDNKENRPFIGIVIKINDINYYAPLTSPKPKHLKMKNQMDFLKIDNGKLGAINFNNMIPVNDTNLSKIEINSIEDIQYKKLLENQLSWCNKIENIKNILVKAEKLYKYITNNNFKNNNVKESIKERCCDFKKLEQVSLLYNKDLSNEISKISLKEKIKNAKNKIELNKIEKNLIHKNQNKSLDR